MTRRDGDPAWVGQDHESRLFLSEREDAAVRAAHDRAVSRASALDAVLRRVAGGCGGEIAGDDGERVAHRVKSLDSLRRKVAQELARDEDLPAALDAVDDLNRYTVVLPPDRYTDGVRAAVADLDRAGYPLERGSNTWDDPIYQGFNTWVRDSDSGDPVEVQYHTPESYAAKQDSHPAYQLARTGGEPLEVARGLEYRRAQLTAAVTPPPGWEDLRWRKDPRPDPPEPSAADLEAADQRLAEFRSRSAGRIPQPRGADVEPIVPVDRSRPPAPRGPPETERLAPEQSSGGRPDDDPDLAGRDRGGAER